MTNHQISFISCIFIAFTLLPATSLFPGGYDLKPGDINADSSLTWRDLHSLVRCLAGKDSAGAHTDLDRSGRTDFRDLMSLMRMMHSLSEVRPVTPEFVVVLGGSVSGGGHVLDSPRVDPGKRFDEDGGASVNYRFISDRPLQNVQLYIEPYLFETSSGVIQDLYRTTDTLEISSGGTSPLKRWRAWVKDSTGCVAEHSGQTKFFFYGRGVLWDYIYFLLGLPIDFPLILHGPWQRFSIAPLGPGAKESWEPDSYVVDLNPAGADSLVFANPDNLARAIMACLVARYPTPSGKNRVAYVCPAMPDDFSSRTNRLIIDRISSLMGGALIEPLDGNTRLLQQLGFPAWLRPELLSLRNYNYHYPEGWTSEYRQK